VHTVKNPVIEHNFYLRQPSKNNTISCAVNTPAAKGIAYLNQKREADGKSGFESKRWAPEDYFAGWLNTTNHAVSSLSSPAKTSSSLGLIF
jgi:hypothetical protein